MSFQWEHYIELAERLNQESATFAETEACQRSAISRAYYEAFGLAREVAVLEGLTLTKKAEDHKNVEQHYRKSTRKSRQQIGLELNRLRRLRSKADYDLFILH
ncbi:MAG: DNA-binding protein [Calditrichaeota bacterium]|nr:MAG: DNA-binding protein [Calditrichota bacterium]